MINILRTLVDREDNIQGQMGSVRSEMGVSEGTYKKRERSKTLYQERRKPLMGFKPICKVDWTQLRKESKMMIQMMLALQIMSLLNLMFLLYQGIVDLQCCVIFRYTAK